MSWLDAPIVVPAPPPVRNLPDGSAPERNLRMPPAGVPDSLTAGPPGGQQVPISPESYDTPSISMQAAPVEMNPALAPIKQRESGGQPFVGYTPPGMALVDLSKAPLDETGFPIWSGNRDPSSGLMSHAAGLYQIQPGTWKPIAKELGITDFSIESQTRVANELYRREGGKPWAASEPGNSFMNAPIVGAGNFSVSPTSIADEQAKPDTRVVWMGPDEYKKMVQPTAEPEERPESKSLRKSLDKGEQITSLPELTVSLKDGQYIVKDQDGWRRADAAEKAGVQIIPVAIHGATGDANTIVSMNGTAMPFNFKPVPQVTHADEARELRQKYGIVGGALAAIGRDIGDVVGGAIRSFGEGAAEGGRDIAGVGPSQPGENVSPGVFGAEAAFAGAPVTKRLALPGEGGAMEMVGGRAAAAPAGNFTPVNPATANEVANLNQARAAVSERVGQGMVPPAEIERRLTEARGMGQPLTLPDVAGKPVSDLLGTVYRQGGEPAAKIKQFLEGRDKTAGPRALDALSKYIGSSTGALSKVREELANVRSANAKPLWDKALEGGSIAPLEQQFQKVWADAGKAVSEAERDLKAADARVTQAAARQSQAGNVYSSSASNSAATFAKDQATNASARLQQAIKTQNQALEKLRAAQADGTANAPGAIWSPRLQNFIDDPVVQQGIRHGQTLERLDALAENRPLNLTEYAVVGTKPDGEWIVGAVPTFRLLKVAKQGLDAMVEANTDSLTGRVTETGRSYAKVRDALRNELDRLNPAYKPAREAWEGDTASIRAVNFGRDMLERGKDKYTADITQHIAEMTPNEKEFAKVGLAATLREKLLTTVRSADESKALINNEATKQRIRPLFTSEQAADEFLNFVENERTMFDTQSGALRGSQTAERQAADASPLRQGMGIARALAHLATGHPAAAGNALLHTALRAAERPQALSPEVRNAIADLLTDPNVGLFAGDARGILPPLRTPPQPNALSTLMQRLPATRNALGMTPLTQLGSESGLPVRLPPPQQSPPMQFRIPPQGPNP